MSNTLATHKPIKQPIQPQKRHTYMNRVSHKFMLRMEAINSKGQAPLCIKFFINAQKLVISLNQMLLPSQWNHDTQEVKTNCPNHLEINNILAEASSRKFRIIANANMANIVLNKQSFKQMFLLDYNNNNFVEWAIEDCKKRIGGIDKSTSKAHLAVFNKLSMFKKEIPFSELNIQTLERFEQYMVKKNNNINTRHNAFKTIKTYVNRAIKSGILFSNPFTNYKILRGSTQRSYLDEKELKKLLNIYDQKTLPHKLNSSLLLYLLSAFTSLRISDVRKLKAEDLQNKSIKIKPFKTRKLEKLVEIPLTNVSQRLIKEAFQYKGKMKSEQKINEDLKTIAHFAEINKRITFHTARHTFATIFLQLGGKVETLKEILGHTNISTTMIYVHITDQRKQDEMKNFDKQFS